jgi:hypothetical protein
MFVEMRSMQSFVRFAILGTLLSGCVVAHPPYRARIPARNVSRAVPAASVPGAAPEPEPRYASAP